MDKEEKKNQPDENRDEEKVESIPVYIQRKDCTEEEVNAFIKLGYSPWQVTPVLEEVRRNGITTFYKTTLIYHLVRRKQ
jgi:Holliday junction resolvasome RuvABC DNA-binding subunit